MRELLPILLVFCALASAGTTGRVTGIVTGPDGDPAIGASVIVPGTAIGSMTDGSGEYLIHNLQPGEYILEARLVGASSQTVEGVVIISDMTTRIDFDLGEGTAGSTVIQVSGQRGMIVFDETSTVHVIRREDIETMPVTSLQELTGRQAGALYAGGGVHMRGGRTGEVLYLVDGIPVMDPTTNLFSMNLPLSAISEVTVMSGGFSAEYGNAQSGIVNIVTRDGGSSYSGSMEGRAGAFSIVGDERVNLTDFTQWEDQIYRGDATIGSVSIGGPEPITGYLLPAMGIEVPGESSLFFSGEWQRCGHDRMDSRGYWDNNPVDMWTGNLKLTSRINGTRIMFSGYYSNSRRGWRDWFWSRINEHDIDDGDTLHYAKEEEFALPTRINENWSITTAVTQTVSDNMFLEVKYGFFRTIERYRIRDLDEGYIGDGFTIDDWLAYDTDPPAVDPDGFYRSAEHPWLRHDSDSRVHTVRADLTWQTTAHHQLKGGFENRSFLTSVSDIYHLYDAGSVILSFTEPAEPIMTGLYIQDRIEYIAGLIVNAGIRLDRFNPNFEGAEAKTHFSPRLGISHPITERDIIRASYGHYYQVPNLTLMYWGSSVSQSGDLDPLYGNPDLDPEQTVSYELGLKHAFDDFTMVDVTGFYKNITGLVSTEYDETTGEYWRFVNGEGTGTVRGAEFTFLKRMDRFWGIDLNYTYSVAKGPRSSPLEVYQYGVAQPLPNDDIYLDWDQRHMANVTLNLQVPRGAGPRIGGYHFLEGTRAGISWNYGSGIPYDNAGHGTHPFFRNQKTYPYRMTTNLTVNRDFWIGDLTFSAYTTIYNLFNRRNIDRIYDVAWYDADQDGDGEPDHDPTGSTGNPAAWSPSRHFLFGLRFNW